MKPFSIAALLVASAQVAAPAHTPGASSTPTRFALVELFTSEGCSSCPPADALLARLAADAAHAGEPIAALSFHVTYWNQLGWTDRFSDEAYTRRQGAYARRFALQSMYTPQMVVDGASEFVGSNSAVAERAVRDALARTRSTSVTLDAHPDQGGISATCHVTSAPEGSVLWVAWADAEEASAPDRGENEGRKLRHVNVVRALERIPIEHGAYTGAVHLARPEAVPGRVVAWVQQGDVGAVLAGASISIGARSGGSW